MSSNSNLDDYWTQQYIGASEPSDPYLDVKLINGVQPLEARFDVVTPKTVPQELLEPLFGQVESRENLSDGAVATEKRITPLQTYAILDGAKVVGLQELLSDAGLEHRCLFQGRSFEELKDVAPWVVRLEKTNSFTRNLFTQSDAGWHLWDKEPGIYIRSHGTLDDMWRHFRRFTRVRDEHGKWFYFRFWETGFSAMFFSGNPYSAQEVGAKFGGSVSRVICQSREGCFTVIEPSDMGLPANARLPSDLVGHYNQVFERHRWNQFVDRFAPVMMKKLGAENYAVSEADIRDMCEQAKSEDYHFEDEIETYILNTAAQLSTHSKGSTL